jgi:hypothetical protein
MWGDDEIVLLDLHSPHLFLMYQVDDFGTSVRPLAPPKPCPSPPGR